MVSGVNNQKNTPNFCSQTIKFLATKEGERRSKERTVMGDVDLPVPNNNVSSMDFREQIEFVGVVVF